MRFLIAWKVFWKGWKNPQAAKEWLEGKKEKLAHDTSHLRLLYLLQKSGRLIDFLKEDITAFSDAQVGSAVRKIQSECGRTLEEFVALRPIFTEKEGSRITISEGYNPSEIKVVGKVKGAPPYEGVIRHAGWKAHKPALPKQTGEGEEAVVCPAEVEVLKGQQV